MDYLGPCPGPCLGCLSVVPAGLLDGGLTQDRRPGLRSAVPNGTCSGNLSGRDLRGLQPHSQSDIQARDRGSGRRRGIRCLLGKDRNGRQRRAYAFNWISNSGGTLGVQCSMSPEGIAQVASRIDIVLRRP
jgi:hypothetical protein